MSQFIIKSEKREKYSVLKLMGSSVAVSRQDDDVISLRKTFKDFAAGEEIHVIADLSGLSYMASDTIGSLLSGLSILRKKGGNLVLYKPTEYVKKIFDIISLSQVLKISDNWEEAEEYLFNGKI